jgi:hypothetical protein
LPFLVGLPQAGSRPRFIPEDELRLVFNIVGATVAINMAMPRQ